MNVDSWRSGMDEKSNNRDNEFPLPTFTGNYKIFYDERGSFSVLGNPSFLGKPDIDSPSVQANVSVSHPGVLRGMHWQKQFPQGKLVKVLYGCVLDVVVDIRPKSPTFKKVFSYALTNDRGPLFIPRGFAHGFYNIGKTDAVFHYLVDNVYSPENERGLLWSSIDFNWPISSGELILSKKDREYPKIDDVSESDLL